MFQIIWRKVDGTSHHLAMLQAGTADEALRLYVEEWKRTEIPLYKLEALPTERRVQPHYFVRARIVRKRKVWRYDYRSWRTRKVRREPS